jgi:hypothetical protein
MVGVQHDKTLKINTHKGLPCGNEGFIRSHNKYIAHQVEREKIALAIKCQ